MVAAAELASDHLEGQPHRVGAGSGIAPDGALPGSAALAASRRGTAPARAGGSTARCRVGRHLAEEAARPQLPVARRALLGHPDETPEMAEVVEPDEDLTEQPLERGRLAAELEDGDRDVRDRTLDRGDLEGCSGRPAERRLAFGAARRRPEREADDARRALVGVGDDRILDPIAGAHAADDARRQRLGRRMRQDDDGFGIRQQDGLHRGQRTPQRRCVARPLTPRWRAEEGVEREGRAALRTHRERADEVGVREVVGAPVRRCGAEHEAHPGADAGPRAGVLARARWRPERLGTDRLAEAQREIRGPVEERAQVRSDPCRRHRPIGLEARDELAHAPGRDLELGPGVALAPMTRGRRLDAPVRDAQLRHPPGMPVQAARARGHVRDREPEGGLDRRGPALTLDAVDDRGHGDERARWEQRDEVVGERMVVARRPEAGTDGLARRHRIDRAGVVDVIGIDVGRSPIRAAAGAAVALARGVARVDVPDELVHDDRGAARRAARRVEAVELVAKAALERLGVRRDRRDRRVEMAEVGRTEHDLRHESRERGRLDRERPAEPVERRARDPPASAMELQHDVARHRARLDLAAQPWQRRDRREAVEGRQMRTPWRGSRGCRRVRHGGSPSLSRLSVHRGRSSEASAGPGLKS